MNLFSKKKKTVDEYAKSLSEDAKVIITKEEVPDMLGMPVTDTEAKAPDIKESTFTDKTFEEAVKQFSQKDMIEQNTERLKDVPFYDLNLIKYILGENPKQKVYFSPNDLGILCEYLDYHWDEITKLKTIPEKMAFIFGDDWDEVFVPTVEEALAKAQKDLVENPANTHLSIEDGTNIANTLNVSQCLMKASDFPATVTSASTEYEMVNHPNHYNNYDIEVIDMMTRIWGKQKTADWCELTAFKYRMRAGTKPGNDINQDLEKEKWYLNKMKELRDS